MCVKLRRFLHLDVCMHACVCMYLGRPAQVVGGLGGAQAQVLVARQLRVEELRQGEGEEAVHLVGGGGQVLGGGVDMCVGYEMGEK